MEGGPVDTSIVTFQDVLDDCVCVPEQVCLTLVRPGHLLFKGHGSLVRLILLPQTGDVPHSDRQIHRGRDDEIVPWVELGTHDIVIVPRQDGDARPSLPIPYPYRLIVRSGDDPGIFTVEEDGPDVVQVYSESQLTTQQLPVVD